MVGYKVEYLTETIVAKRLDHIFKGRLVAELRVKLAMVDDIIAMLTTGARFQIGRGVNVAHTQSRQI